MRRIWMGAATGAWLPHTVALVITRTSPGPEKWQLCRLLALRRTCGWTEGPEQLSSISLYTMQTSTYSALSGMKRTMMVFRVPSVACRPGVFLWVLGFGDMGEHMFWKEDRQLQWCAFLSPLGGCTHQLEAVLTFLMLQRLGCGVQVTSVASWLIKVNTWICNISR